MERRPSAAADGIVHRGEVVENEGSGVHEFDGDRDRERPGGLCPDEVASGERHERPEPLAAGERRLLDSFPQPAGSAAGRGKVAGKRRFEPGAGDRGELVECSPVRECRGAAFDRGPG